MWLGESARRFNKQWLVDDCCSFWLLFFGCNVNHGFWWQTCVSRIFAHICTIFTHVDGTWLYMPSCSKCIVCWWPQIFFFGWSQGTFSTRQAAKRQVERELIAQIQSYAKESDCVATDDDYIWLWLMCLTVWRRLRFFFKWNTILTGIMC